MSSLVSRYPDLVPAPPDPALEQVVRDLDRAYGPENPQVGPPPEWRAQLGTALAHRAAETAPRTLYPRWVPIHSWRQAGLAVVVSVVALSVGILGLAFTDGPRYETPSPPSPSAMIRALSLYGHTVNQSRQYCGYAVSVIRAYSDANRVIVEWTIHGPTNRTFAGLEGTSVIEATGLIPGTSGRTRLQAMDQWPGGMKDNTVAMYSAFDAHQIAHGAKPLQLQFRLTSFSMAEPVGDYPTMATGCEHISGTSGLTSQSIGSLQDYARALVARWKPDLFSRLAYIVEVDHEFTIPVTVAMDPIRVEVHPAQKITAGGVTLILDHVIATRSEVRVYLRRAKPGHILEDSRLTLSAGNSSGEAWALFQDYWTRVAPADRLYDFAFANLHYTAHANYTLVMRRNPNESLPGSSWRVLKGGPWVFHFTLP
jgi:hypothetical protein